MIDAQTYQKEQSEKGYHYPYSAQLLLERAEKLDSSHLSEALHKHSEGIITETEPIENPLDIFASALLQTWDWPEAETAILKTKAVLGITDRSTELPRKDRLQLFHKVVQAAIDLVEPVAIHWLPSQRIVNPQRYKEDLAQGGLLFSSAVNVRIFKVEQSNERVMDTMGLTGLGCPDLQCYFTGLDPTQIAVYLYQLSEYVFERGDVFRDGHTIDGLQPNERWRVRIEMAHVAPTRRVVNIIPGQYAPPLG